MSQHFTTDQDHVAILAELNVAWQSDLYPVDPEWNHDSLSQNRPLCTVRVVPVTHEHQPAAPLHRPWCPTLDVRHPGPAPALIS